MSEHIDRVCGDLRIKLHGIDRRLEALKGNAMATSEKSQHVVESQLDRVEQRIYDNRIAVEAEAYAGAVFDLTVAAADEAIQAALEALLARNDANLAAMPESWTDDEP